MKKLSLALAAGIALLFAASSASAAPAKGNLTAARAMQGMAAKKATAANPNPPPAIKKARLAIPHATRATLRRSFLRMRRVR